MAFDDIGDGVLLRPTSRRSGGSCGPCARGAITFEVSRLPGWRPRRLPRAVLRHVNPVSGTFQLDTHRPPAADRRCLGGCRGSATVARRREIRGSRYFASGGTMLAWPFHRGVAPQQPQELGPVTTGLRLQQPPPARRFAGQVPPCSASRQSRALPPTSRAPSRGSPTWRSCGFLRLSGLDPIVQDDLDQIRPAAAFLAAIRSMTRSRSGGSASASG